MHQDLLPALLKRRAHFKMDVGVVVMGIIIFFLFQYCGSKSYLQTWCLGSGRGGDVRRHDAWHLGKGREKHRFVRLGRKSCGLVVGGWDRVNGRFERYIRGSSKDKDNNKFSKNRTIQKPKRTTRR